MPYNGVEIEYNVDSNGHVFSCIGVCEDSSEDPYRPTGFSAVSEIPFGDYVDCGDQFASVALSLASPKKTKRELQLLREEILSDATSNLRTVSGGVPRFRFFFR